MDFLQELTGLNIDFIIVVMVIAGGFFAKQYITWEHIHIGSFRMKLTDAWKTLIVGTLFCSIYALILLKTGALPKDAYLRFFYSYIFSTSFYELIIKPFTTWMRKKFGADEPEGK